VAQVKELDGGGGEGFGREFDETCRVEVGAGRYSTIFVGCVQNPVQALGSVRGNRQEAYIVDDLELGAENP